jgi:hypothetical protein
MNATLDIIGGPMSVGQMLMLIPIAAASMMHFITIVMHTVTKRHFSIINFQVEHAWVMITKASPTD